MANVQEKYPNLVERVLTSMNSTISSFSEQEEYAKVSVNYTVNESTILSHIEWLISKEENENFDLRDVSNFGTSKLIPTEEPQKDAVTTSNNKSSVNVVDTPPEIISISQPPIQLELENFKQNVKRTIRIGGGGGSSSGGFLFDTSSFFNPIQNIR